MKYLVPDEKVYYPATVSSVCTKLRGTYHYGHVSCRVCVGFENNHVLNIEQDYHLDGYEEQLNFEHLCKVLGYDLRCASYPEFNYLCKKKIEVSLYLDNGLRIHLPRRQ